jgi:hypothetical protein
MTSTLRPRLIACLLTGVLVLSGCAPDSDPQPVPDVVLAPAPAPVPGGTPGAMPTDPQGQPAPEPVGLAHIYVDGWSLRSVGRNRLVALVDGETVELQFRPVRAEEAAQLVSEVPELVATTISRMVDGASDVACAPSGCVASGAAVDLAWLTDAAQVPGFGESYKAWNLQGALEVATVDVTQAGSLTLVSDGWDELALPLVANRDGDLAEVTGRALDLGFDQDRFLIAGAFGRLFVPEALWASEQAAPYVLDAAPASAASKQDAAATYLPLFGGLGQLVPAAAGLTGSQLTYLSSPTTGCGLVALCAPTAAVDAKVTPVGRTQVQVCTAEGDRTFASLVDAVVSLDLRSTPIPQRGATGGSAPTSEGFGPFSGPLPLLGQQDELRIAVVQVVEEGGQLYDVAGLMYQRSVSDPASFAENFDPARILKAHPYFSAC